MQRRYHITDRSRKIIDSYGLNFKNKKLKRYTDLIIILVLLKSIISVTKSIINVTKSMVHYQNLVPI